jgi:hypothetical protein
MLWFRITYSSISDYLLEYLLIYRPKLINRTQNNFMVNNLLVQGKLVPPVIIENQEFP